MSKTLLAGIANANDIKKDYNIGAELGTGAFSVVKKATHKETGKEVAVKIMDKSTLANSSHLQMEIKIMKSVSHKNVVDLFEIYEDDKHVYLVMELLTGGELFDRIVNDFPNGYSEKLACTVITDIIDAIQYLHSMGIVHRDLKPENLLYQSKNPDSLIKITDFGLAKIADGDVLFQTACGSPNYVAPEILLNEGYDSSVDMWSIGVILYILLCGFPPFYSNKMPELFEQIVNAEFQFPSPYWDHISSDAKDIITKLLQVDPKKRFTPDQCLSHPWVKTMAPEAAAKINPSSQLKGFNDNRKTSKPEDAVEEAQRLINKVKGGMSSLPKKK